jgi:uncharacterized protein with HEPN domain
MNKDIRVYLEDILDCIKKIQTYATDETFDSFSQNVEKQDAVVRRLEIIGEAVKKLPNEVKVMHPEIPWKQIAGMRDVLIHEYAGIRLERVWKVITDDLKILKSAVSAILKSTK